MDGYHLDKSATVCHRDLRLGNVSFAGDEPTLFDFEALALGPPAYDLACLWRRRVIECGMKESSLDWDPYLCACEHEHAIVAVDLHFMKLLAICARSGP